MRTYCRRCNYQNTGKHAYMSTHLAKSKSLLVFVRFMWVCVSVYVCVCLCVGFSSAELCCQAYRKWIIQIGFAKWIFIETVARHFVAVAVVCIVVYFVPKWAQMTFALSACIFLLTFTSFFFCVWVTIFRNLMWPVARFCVRPVARFCVTVCVKWLKTVSLMISSYRNETYRCIDIRINRKSSHASTQSIQTSVFILVKRYSKTYWFL